MPIREVSKINGAHSNEEGKAMRNLRNKLLAAAALGALAAVPIAAQACSQYNASAAAQPADPTLAMIRQVEAQMNAPFPGDLVRFIAQQQAAMDAMFQQIDAITAQALRDPGAIEVALPPGSTGPASTVMVSSFSNGQGMCSETVTYTYDASGEPRVSVQKTGNACGNATLGNGQTPVFTTPQPTPQTLHTIQVKGPAYSVPHYIRG
jgi:hypothetical protein